MVKAAPFNALDVEVADLLYFNKSLKAKKVVTEILLLGEAFGLGKQAAFLLRTLSSFLVQLANFESLTYPFRIEAPNHNKLSVLCIQTHSYYVPSIRRDINRNQS